MSVQLRGVVCASPWLWVGGMDVGAIWGVVWKGSGVESMVLVVG